MAKECQYDKSASDSLCEGCSHINLSIQRGRPVAKTMREFFMEQERDQARLALSMVQAQISDAVADLENGDVDEALATLNGILGREKGNDDRRQTEGG
jgi:hypothetical protein